MSNSLNKTNLKAYLKICYKYDSTKDIKYLSEINNFINNVINKDKHYYSKLTKYYDTNFITTNDLKFLIGGGIDE